MPKHYTHQPIPCKRGDIVRVLPDQKSEQEFWGHIAVVTQVDKGPKDGGYPYRMHLLDHPYTDEIWFERYEVIGNALEAVGLLWYRKHPVLLASLNKKFKQGARSTRKGHVQLQTASAKRLVVTKRKPK